MEKMKVAKSRGKIWFGMALSKFVHKSHQHERQYSLLAKLWKTNDQAAANYMPKVYPGKVVHFLPIREYARFVGPEFGWDKLAAGGVEGHHLPVYPAGMLLDPFVQHLAIKLKACIEKEFKTETRQ